ncbi:Cytochrome P450 [Prauserella marina]|uniref:Cytochrome P450 n=2 Tax=Prauserella marina TaxID=530584 RepID=A0A1G6K060_9PSEU|nr:cytochrome P450 [Prauserella marina]SDC23676.1 Cytochrome P450 [Prauserella marina]
MGLCPLRFLDSQGKRADGYVQLRSAPRAKFLVWQADALKWLFKTDSSLDHPGSRSLSSVLGVNSLLWADGERHERFRRVLAPPVSARQLPRWHSMVAATVDRAIDRLKPGMVFSPTAMARQVALEIAGAIVLGSRADVLDEFATWLDRTIGSVPRTLAYRLFLGGFPRSPESLDRRLVAAVRQAAAEGRPSLASLLADGEFAGIEDGELRDHVASLLFAGHETSASAVAWTLHWIVENDDVLANVLAELRGSTANGSTASGLPYLQACVQESLRITPPVPNAANRQVGTDTPLLGTTIPARAVLAPSIYLAHRQRDVFPNPGAFDPGRFLERKPQSHQYLPFGSGTRHCIGSQLAQLEMRLFVASLLRRRTLRKVRPGRARLRGHTLTPSSAFRMRVVACHD